MVDETAATTSSMTTAAMASTNNSTNTSTDIVDWNNVFRQKTVYMKTWKPASSPSNRDRLELYAFHKQAVSGDAPGNITTQSAADRAKYQAWRSKSGLSSSEAMRLYCVESDRQVRVYGLQQQQQQSQQQNPPGGSLQTGTTPQNTPAGQDPSQQASHHSNQPRGLAAIPLLCAAASETRQAYLRRLANTPVEHAWWARQEPLCATPGTLCSMPETALIATAALLERVSLTSVQDVIPLPVVQSFLWPIHNCLLSLWMGLILNYTAWKASVELCKTVLWGSRRTGHALGSIWKDQVAWGAQSVHVLVEAHQPVTARLVGVTVLPLTVIVNMCNHVIPGGLIWMSIFYATALLATWWYWWITLPWLAAALLFAGLLAGNCFALIELAGV